MKTIDILESYGLTQKESEVYLALLALGSVNLQEIAKNLDFPRTTIYNTLNYLINKGLASYIIEGGVRYYESADPEKLVDKITEKKILIESIIPELKAVQKTLNQQSKVEIYRGTKGISTILSDIFTNPKNLKYFGSYNLSKEVLKHLPQHYRTIRIDKKIKAKIVIEKPVEEIFADKNYQKITEIRYNESLKQFPCMIFMYDKKVAIYTVKKEIIGIIIDNEQTCEAMEMIFEMYWNSAN